MWYRVIMVYFTCIIVSLELWLVYQRIKYLYLQALNHPFCLKLRVRMSIHLAQPLIVFQPYFNWLSIAINFYDGLIISLWHQGFLRPYMPHASPTWFCAVTKAEGRLHVIPIRSCFEVEPSPMLWGFGILTWNLCGQIKLSVNETFFSFYLIFKFFNLS